jgi:hypothetical protein
MTGVQGMRMRAGEGKSWEMGAKRGAVGLDESWGALPVVVEHAKFYSVEGADAVIQSARRVRRKIYRPGHPAYGLKPYRATMYVNTIAHRILLSDATAQKY